MKKTIYILISFVLLFMQAKVNVNALDVSAQSAVLIDAYSGKIVYEKNAYQRLGMASTTKIMTALTALTEIDLSNIDEAISVSDKAIGIEGSSIYLNKGEKLTASSMVDKSISVNAVNAVIILVVLAIPSL